MTVDKIVQYLSEDCRRWDECLIEIDNGKWDTELPKQAQLDVYNKIKTKREYVGSLLQYIRFSKNKTKGDK
jgi:hypothetical protein